MQERVPYKDVYDVTSPADETLRDGPSREYVDKPLLQKIQAFEPVLEDAKEVSNLFYPTNKIKNEKTQSNRYQISSSCRKSGCWK